MCIKKLVSKSARYRGLTIEIRDDRVTNEQITDLILRAATREGEGETLGAAIDCRLKGENYQLADEIATRAFEHELHLARLAGEIAGYHNAGEIRG